ncbi:hypothetical protein PMKS-003734 [Pichia membranifaciens]|uniref:Uncharacterized protein n=1 Tax=Pichia membranifaciens TaxID=4926 RepID=A0A1Q2YL06_9ASCO|nr:hypothetical protein PMKS-003734 [Pichia membranifaciens]
MPQRRQDGGLQQKTEGAQRGRTGASQQDAGDRRGEPAGAGGSSRKQRASKERLSREPVAAAGEGHRPTGRR